jgi:hypothetical protein
MILGWNIDGKFLRFHLARYRVILYLLSNHVCKGVAKLLLGIQCMAQFVSVVRVNLHALFNVDGRKVEEGFRVRKAQSQQIDASIDDSSNGRMGIND